MHMSFRQKTLDFYSLNLTRSTRGEPPGKISRAPDYQIPVTFEDNKYVLGYWAIVAGQFPYRKESHIWYNEF